MAVVATDNDFLTPATASQYTLPERSIPCRSRSLVCLDRHTRIKGPIIFRVIHSERWQMQVL